MITRSRSNHSLNNDSSNSSTKNESNWYNAPLASLFTTISRFTHQSNNQSNNQSSDSESEFDLESQTYRRQSSQSQKNLKRPREIDYSIDQSSNQSHNHHSRKRSKLNFDHSMITIDMAQTTRRSVKQSSNQNDSFIDFSEQSSDDELLESICLSLDQTSDSYHQVVKRSHTRTFKQSVKQSVKQSNDRTDDQTNNQPIIQSIDQNECHLMPHFPSRLEPLFEYKRLLNQSNNQSIYQSIYQTIDQFDLQTIELTVEYELFNQSIKHWFDSIDDLIETLPRVYKQSSGRTDNQSVIKQSKISFYHMLQVLYGACGNDSRLRRLMLVEPHWIIQCYQTINRIVTGEWKQSIKQSIDQSVDQTETEVIETRRVTRSVSNQSINKSTDSSEESIDRSRKQSNDTYSRFLSHGASFDLRSARSINESDNQIEEIKQYLIEQSDNQSNLHSMLLSIIYLSLLHTNDSPSVKKSHFGLALIRINQSIKQSNNQTISQSITSRPRRSVSEYSYLKQSINQIDQSILSLISRSLDAPLPVLSFGDAIPDLPIRSELGLR